jgi:hypothetical protein
MVSFGEMAAIHSGGTARLSALKGERQSYATSGRGGKWLVFLQRGLS